MPQSTRERPLHEQFQLSGGPGYLRGINVKLAGRMRGSFGRKEALSCLKYLGSGTRKSVWGEKSIPVLVVADDALGKKPTKAMMHHMNKQWPVVTEGTLKAVLFAGAPVTRLIFPKGAQEVTTGPDGLLYRSPASSADITEREIPRNSVDLMWRRIISRTPGIGF